MPYLKPAFWTVTCTLRLVHSGHLDLSDFMEVNGRPAGEINPARSNVGMANTFQQYACLPAVRSPECSGIITWNTMNTHIKKSSRYFRCSSLQYQPQVCRCQGRSQPSEFHSKARSWQTVGALSCCVLLRKCSMIAKDSTLLQQISMSGTVADSLADWTPKKKILEQLSNCAFHLDGIALFQLQGICAWLSNYLLSSAAATSRWRRPWIKDFHHQALLLNLYCKV